MNARKKTTPRAKAPQPNLRHVWLAGLGAVSLARRHGAARLATAKQARPEGRKRAGAARKATARKRA